MSDIQEGDLVRLVYDYDESKVKLDHNEVARAGWSLRGAADLSGIGELVNPRSGLGQAYYSIRASRDLTFEEVLAALPRSFTDRHVTLVDPNDSYEEDGMLDGDEQWVWETVEFTLIGLVRT